MPEFVVITPTFSSPGREKRLESAIASVKSQLFKDYIHVVIGDGPTPLAREICEREGVMYEERPREAESLNWGCFSKNYAIDRFDGNRYLFLDDDNVLLPKCLRTIHDVSSKDSEIIVHKTLFYNKWTDQWIILPCILPPQRSKIDLLNFSVSQSLAKAVKFQATPEQDWFFLEECMSLVDSRYEMINEILAVYF